jgi:osmotically-inducible protein OsmY
VLDELEWEPSIDAAEIGVTCHDGIVTLTGSVPSYAEKVTAEQVTQRVRGVKGIANDVESRLHGTSLWTDGDIAAAAVNTLGWKAFLPKDRIKVAVSKGWVTLEGDVDWQFQRTAALEAVRHLHGVKGVINEITIKQKVLTADVKSRIEAAFRRSAELDAEKVRVDSRSGKVTLLGELHSWSERHEAERTAWSAPGVTEVENLIMITPEKACEEAVEAPAFSLA